MHVIESWTNNISKDRRHCTSHIVQCVCQTNDQQILVSKVCAANLTENFPLLCENGAGKPANIFQS